MMMRMSVAPFHLVVAVVVFVTLSAQAQTISDQFPHLFRGGRRPKQDHNAKPSYFVAIEPVDAAGEKNTNPVQQARNAFQKEGLIRLREDVWHQEEIEIQLFPSQSSRFRFRQSPTNQPVPNMFYGTAVDSGEGDDVDSISLLQSTVTGSRISVVTGSIHVHGTLYQIRQLPGRDLIVEQRSLDDFDDEFEIEEDDMEGRVASYLPEPKVTLKVDNPGDPHRLLLRPVDTEASWRNSSFPNINPSLINANHRLMQGNDDGSRLDIMVHIRHLS